jgi:hypothetical protein
VYEITKIPLVIFLFNMVHTPELQTIQYNYGDPHKSICYDLELLRRLDLTISLLIEIWI